MNAYKIIINTQKTSRRRYLPLSNATNLVISSSRRATRAEFSKTYDCQVNPANDGTHAVKSFTNGTRNNLRIGVIWKKMWTSGEAKLSKLVLDQTLECEGGKRVVCDL